METRSVNNPFVTNQLLHSVKNVLTQTLTYRDDEISGTEDLNLLRITLLSK